MKIADGRGYVMYQEVKRYLDINGKIWNTRLQAIEASREEYIKRLKQEVGSNMATGLAPINTSPAHATEALNIVHANHEKYEFFLRELAEIENTTTGEDL